jgi:multiple sugar transport system substrate-binding protein
MKEVRFSVCNEPDDVQATLKLFNQKHLSATQVQLHWVPWDHQKQELTAMALYGKGVDVSQVGGPVVSDLIAMNALRPFSSEEINSLGGSEAFSPIVWHNSRRTSDGLVYAVPWVLDSRAIFYWRDMLETAKVDEHTAFSSFERMEDTFECLQKNGVTSPWALALSGGPLIQPACTWIWGAGGDIADEKDLLILHPKSLLGLRRFFGLYRYMPVMDQPLDFDFTYFELFAKRQVAVTMGSLAPFIAIKNSLSQDLQTKLGVALAPGPLFVGSSSLAIWKGNRDAGAAMDLVRYLLGEEAQQDYCYRGGYLPVRLSVLEKNLYSTDSHLSVFAESALKGRTFTDMKLSGLFEDLLSAAVKRIWLKIIATPGLDLDGTIQQELEPIVRRASLWSE